MIKKLFYEIEFIKKIITFDHGTIIRTGITCKKIPL